VFFNLKLEGMGPPCAVLACRCDDVVGDPRDAVDTSVVAVLDDNARRRGVDAPHDDVLVERAAHQVRRIRRPSEAVHSRSVEHPAGHFDGF